MRASTYARPRGIGLFLAAIAIAATLITAGCKSLPPPAPTEQDRVKEYTLLLTEKGTILSDPQQIPTTADDHLSALVILNIVAPSSEFAGKGSVTIRSTTDGNDFEQSGMLEAHYRKDGSIYVGTWAFFYQIRLPVGHYKVYFNSHDTGGTIDVVTVSPTPSAS